MQLAIKVALRPTMTADGETVRLQTGAPAAVTVTMATAPNIWLPVLAVTVYSVVADGVTVQLAPAVPTQVPPVQRYEIGMEVQLVVRVEEPPGLIVGGDALNVQENGRGCTVTVAEVVLPVPTPLVPSNG